MSMIAVPSLSRESRSMPGNGLDRLYRNLAPITTGVSGVGDTCYDDLGNPVDCGIATSVSPLPPETTYPVVATPDVLAGAGPLAPGETYDPVTLATAQAAAQAAAANPAQAVTVTTQNANGTTSTSTMTPAQLAALINSSSGNLAKILAITQGGSVLANGSIIGSSTAAGLAASATTISGAGLSAILGNPMVLLLLIGGVFLATRKN